MSEHETLLALTRLSRAMHASLVGQWPAPVFYEWERAIKDAETTLAADSAAVQFDIHAAGE